MVRSEVAADESLAAIRARIKLGIAIAAMIRMIATTIRSSISEKPLALLLLSFRIYVFPQVFMFFPPEEEGILGKSNDLVFNCCTSGANLRARSKIDRNHGSPFIFNW